MLGEYISAPHLDYQDCKSFQIVCPACYEPIFKVARNVRGSFLEYLSHYPETESDTEVCELRVKNISSEKMEVSNSVARNQRLDYFLHVLRDMIGAHAMYPNGYSVSQKRLNRSKPLQKLRELAFSHQKKQEFDRGAFYSFAEEYVDDISEVGGVIKTAFTMTVQKRIAFDVWNYIVSNKGKDNYNFLFNHAYLVVLSRLQRSADSGCFSADEEFLANRLIDLANTSKKRGMIILSQMANTPVGPPYAIEGSNFLNKAAAEIMHEMVGTLLTLPYFEWLKKTDELG